MNREPSDAELASLADESRKLTAEMVELQASLMRRWIKATAEWRRGDCTTEEYEDYLLMLRGIARRAAQENDPLFGAAPHRRAQAYAHPLVLGRVGTGLTPVHVSSELHVDIPDLPPLSEWSYHLFGKTHKTTVTMPKRGKDRLKAWTGMKSAHPSILRPR